MQQDNRELWLVRHGETEWSLSGAHTGRTDIPLTPRGEQQARQIAPALAGADFALVLSSPLRRARETCTLAGFGDRAQIDPDLVEWDYGAYEGRTTADIRRERPGWSVWDEGVPHGETLDHVAARARNVILRSEAAGGPVLVFGHAHMLRVLTACWLELPPREARLFALGTASLGKLGCERETRVMLSWNVVLC